MNKYARHPYMEGTKEERKIIKQEKIGIAVIYASGLAVFIANLLTK